MCSSALQPRQRGTVPRFFCFTPTFQTCMLLFLGSLDKRSFTTSLLLLCRYWGPWYLRVLGIWAGVFPRIVATSPSVRCTWWSRSLLSGILLIFRYSQIMCLHSSFPKCFLWSGQSQDGLLLICIRYAMFVSVVLVTVYTPLSPISFNLMKYLSSLALSNLFRNALLLAFHVFPLGQI